VEALSKNQYVYEMDGVQAGDEKPGLTFSTVQEWLNVDLSKIVATLAAVSEELRAAGYGLEGTLTISGPLNVTIDL